jgi:hypothetical protein
MQAFPKVKEQMEKWRMEIDPEPMKIKGQLMHPGSILMGNDKKFPADCNPNDFDRNIQQT